MISTLVRDQRGIPRVLFFFFPFLFSTPPPVPPPYLRSATAPPAIRGPFYSLPYLAPLPLLPLHFSFRCTWTLHRTSTREACMPHSSIFHLPQHCPALRSPPLQPTVLYPATPTVHYLPCTAARNVLLDYPRLMHPNCELHSVSSMVRAPELFSGCALW